MPKILILSFTIFFLFGCATGYQSKDSVAGYSETQLDVNSFKVSYIGNSSTSAKEASDYILLRNAELTLNAGYKYFKIVDSQDSSKTRVLKGGNSVRAGNGLASSPGVVSDVTLFEPSVINTIVCMNEPEDGKLIYDAQFIFDSIASKYGINKVAIR